MSCKYDFDYKTKYEFKDSVMRHAEICFEWHGTEYGIFWINGEQWVVTLLEKMIVRMYFTKTLTM